MFIKKFFFAIVASCLTFHPGVTPPAKAMLPVGDSAHRGFYKNQDWIWEQKTNAAASANSSTSNNPAHISVPDVAPASPVLTLDLAWKHPAHPPGDLAFSLSYRPGTEDLAWGFPSHPGTEDLAWGFPSRPGIGVLAFTLPTGVPGGELA